MKHAHTNELFTETIDWALIETHAKDLLRIAISIKVGRVSASTILKRLSGYSRKNQTYLAFRELGRAVRTGFLLRYVTDLELRNSIQAATNKGEQFNKFIKWVTFGAETLASNDRDQQRKLIRYSHLIANCLTYHSVLEYTRVIKDLTAEGHGVGEELLERLDPYRTEHVNRQGQYRLDLSQVPPEPDYSFSFGQQVAVKVVVGGEDEGR